MIHLHLERVDEKTVRITGLNRLVTNCLQGMGEVLAQRDAPAVRQRLLPPPSADAALNAEWEKFVTPDLRHLFVTAAETVVRDLTALERDPQHPLFFRVAFPAAHLNAWMSAINQTRLILGEQFHVTDQALERRDLDPESAADIALLRIHLLGWLLERLVEFSGGAGPADLSA